MEIRKIENQIKVIVPENYVKVPLDCPVCNLSFRGVDDVLNFKKHGCCTDCDLVYRQPNKTKWESGWRPKKQK